VCSTVLHPRSISSSLFTTRLPAVSYLTSGLSASVCARTAGMSAEACPHRVESESVTYPRARLKLYSTPKSLSVINTHCLHLIRPGVPACSKPVKAVHPSRWTCSKRQGFRDVGSLPGIYCPDPMQQAPSNLRPYNDLTCCHANVAEQLHRPNRLSTFPASVSTVVSDVCTAQFGFSALDINGTLRSSCREGVLKYKARRLRGRRSRDPFALDVLC